jgi:uncharacterized membrane protein
VQSRLRVRGYSIQPMLVTVPFGLFVCAAVFDLTDVAGGPAFLGEVGYWTAVAGLVAAVLAAIAGMIDLWDVPPTRTQRTVVRFNVLNAVMAALFLFVSLIRSVAPERGATGVALMVEVLALAIGAASARLGTLLVRRFDQDGGESPAFAVVGPRNRRTGERLDRLRGERTLGLS